MGFMPTRGSHVPPKPRWQELQHLLPEAEEMARGQHLVPEAEGGVESALRLRVRVALSHMAEPTLMQVSRPGVPAEKGEKHTDKKRS